MTMETSAAPTNEPRRKRIPTGAPVSAKSRHESESEIRDQYSIRNFVRPQSSSGRPSSGSRSVIIRSSPLVKCSRRHFALRDPKSPATSNASNSFGAATRSSNVPRAMVTSRRSKSSSPVCRSREIFARAASPRIRSMSSGRNSK